jgi:pyruvate/2-oxoglutarate dehydrogenase complex dihydrolipoamide dehydrogenase (E3) component
VSLGKEHKTMTDIIVIDAGPAGVLAALCAAELGARTTLAASGEFGGDHYTADCVKGLLCWNKVITTAGINYELKLPHVAFHRQIGEFKDVHATPTGDLIDERAGLNAKSSGCRPRTTAPSSEA